MVCTNKKRIQLCITSMLSPGAELIEPSAANSDPIEAPFQSVKSKKGKGHANLVNIQTITLTKKP